MGALKTYNRVFGGSNGKVGLDSREGDEYEQL